MPGKTKRLENNESEVLYEKDALENLKRGYNYLFDDYSQQVARLHNTDQKMNMFFVFNAAIIALLSLIFPLNTNTLTLYVWSVVLLILFFVSMILTIITVIVSLYPKGTIHLSNDNFMVSDFYYRPTNEFMCEIMGQLNLTINTLHKHIERKMLCIKIASFETIFNILIVCALMFLKIL